MLTICVALTGCVTAGQPAGPVSIAPVGTNGPGVLGNGIASARIATLDPQDKQRAIAAEFQALEFQAVGDPLSWEGGSASGEVTAFAPFQVGSQDCRPIVHRISIGSDETVTKGSACRDGSGRWSPLD